MEKKAEIVFKLLISTFLVLINFSAYTQTNTIKINGVCLVSPPNAVPQKNLASIKRINAHWAAIVPYGFSKGYTPSIIYNSDKQWWGEKRDGVIELIKYAKAENINIMLKPHIWVSTDGWAGDFILKSEKEWLLWEQNYTRYIMHFVEIAQQYNVPLFCIGTELRQIVKQRPVYFKKLINNIRKVYTGKLTYAANWDNYKAITFWSSLDFIGIDGYFPLKRAKTPSVSDLRKSWIPYKKALLRLHEKHKKPILFTEYGYESCNYNTQTPWGNNNKYPLNQIAQKNAYEALYQTFWSEKWFAGGFLWKWHLSKKTQRKISTSFTPQNKEAENIIKTYYNIGNN